MCAGTKNNIKKKDKTPKDAAKRMRKVNLSVFLCLSFSLELL